MNDFFLNNNKHVLTGFPLALTEISSTTRALGNGVNAGAAVKKAALQVETQAQLLTSELNSRVSQTALAFYICCADLFRCI